MVRLLPSKGTENASTQLCARPFYPYCVGTVSGHHVALTIAEWGRLMSLTQSTRLQRTKPTLLPTHTKNKKQKTHFLHQEANKGERAK